MTSINEAAENGDLALVRALLKADPGKVNARSLSGSTPLHDASIFKHPKIAQLLLEYGADVNEKGEYGRTALHWAAQCGSVQVAKLLIKNGADIELKDDRGQTPLQIAVYHLDAPGAQSLIDLLIKSGADYDLESAVVLNDVNRVRDILSANSILIQNLPRKNQVLIVHMAIEKPEVMELLLEHGADPNIQSKEVVFPFPPITRVDNLAVAETLLKHGADVNAIGASGLTRLQETIKYGPKELANLLRRYGATEEPKSAKKEKKK